MRRTPESTSGQSIRTSAANLEARIGHVPVVLPKGSIARGVRGAILRATAPPAPPSVAPVWVVCRSCVVDR